MNSDVINSAEDAGTNHPDGFTIIGEYPSQKKSQIARVLPDWLANPTVIDATLERDKLPIDGLPELDKSLVLKLRERNITHFFPVQREVIPWLVRSDLQAMVCRQPDICVSAPTGSGKTLAYVLPIVQALQSRLVVTVRALVVLPVKDLAIQVFQVFQTYCKGTTLRVVLAASGDLLTNEQGSLVKTGPCGSRSLADVIVATPGRLVDHIQHTPGFSLTELRYLVIDEADRMMEEVDNPWLAAVEAAVFGNPSDGHVTCSCGLSLHRRYSSGPLTACLAGHPTVALRKLLYSATLSQDPEKLQRLGLFYPKLFTTTTGGSREHGERGEFVGKYTTPAELSEFKTFCHPQSKPLVVWYLLQHRGFRKVLCFTNSVSSTHRLCQVLQAMGGLKVASFSSMLPQKKRNLLLKRFARGDLNALVTSDALTRGMDVEDVECVLLYDCPPLLKTYIHRVGRTARAGKLGTAITLLEPPQQKKFESMMIAAGKENRVSSLSVTPKDLQPFENIYREALGRVSQQTLREKGKDWSRKNPFQFKRKNFN